MTAIDETIFLSLFNRYVYLTQNKKKNIYLYSQSPTGVAIPNCGPKSINYIFYAFCCGIQFGVIFSVGHVLVSTYYDSSNRGMSLTKQINF